MSVDALKEQLKINTNLVQVESNASPVSPLTSDLNGDFSTLLPKTLNIRDKLGLSTPARFGHFRSSTTPVDISVKSVISILQECVKGFKTLSNHIPGLEKYLNQVSDIKDTLISRERDVMNFFDTPIERATAPPATPAQGLQSASSPIPRHPFSRPISSEQVTLKHWIYDLQKNSWFLNEKTIRYESIVTTILSQGSRQRKLQELITAVHNSWVNLMLHLGLVISQQNSDSQLKISTDLNKLVVATGLAEVVSDLDINNFHSLYIQGEKHLLGYGVPQSFEVAFKRFDIAAQNGLPEAANMIGVMKEHGLGCKKDIAEAIRYYSQAASQSNHDALNHLGRFFEHGKGCEKSLTLACKYYKKAATLGNLDAMANYAHALQNGLGCDKNKELAFEYFSMAAEKGYARAQNALGTCYYQGIGIKKDYFQATIYYKKAADQGYGPAQNNLGICFEEGRGTPLDLVRAKKYYSLAADKKHPGATNNFGYILLLEHEYLLAIEKFYLAKGLGSIDAIFHLGHLYEIGCSDKDGIVLQPDLDMALRFYQEGASKGHTQCLLRLASILICGPERVVDINRAVQCLTIVAETEESKNSIRLKENLTRDVTDAQNMLGELCEMGLHHGIDGSPDMNQAIEWYRRALKKGHARAMFNLGALYEKGEFVPLDTERAIRLFIEADKKGNQDAKERLLKLQSLGIISFQ